MSRSLRQLGVIKVPDGKGGYRYAVPSSESQKHAPVKGFELVSIIRSIIEVKSMLRIKTIRAMQTASAVTIDNAGRYEIAVHSGGRYTACDTARPKSHSTSP
jgi:arginine repressor